MPKKQTAARHQPRIMALRLARVHFFYVLAFAASIIVYDAWQLVPAAAILERWSVASGMLIVVTLIWYLSRSHTIKLQPVVYRTFIYILVLLDIAVASFLVYVERGMASRGVALYAIPIAVSASLASRSTLYTTASLCTAAYWLSAIRYFVINFNEGYKVELYSTLAFYSATFFVLAVLLWIVVRDRTNAA